MDDTFKSHHEAIDKLNHEIFLLQVHFSHFNSFPLALLPAVPSLSVVLGVQCQRASQTHTRTQFKCRDNSSVLLG